MDNQNSIKNDVQENQSFENLGFNNQSNELTSNKQNSLPNGTTNRPTNGLDKLNINENANLLSNELINPLTNKCSSLNSDQSIDNTDFRTFLEQLSTDKMINNDDFENQLNLLPTQVTKDEEFKKAMSELFFPKNELVDQNSKVSNDCKKMNIVNQDTMKLKYIQTYKFSNDKKSNNLAAEINDVQAANNLNTINMVTEDDEKNLIELNSKSNGLKRKRVNPKSTRKDRYQKYCCAIIGIFLIFTMWIMCGYISYEQIIKYHL